MTPPRIGFIGFGEAGFHIASGLQTAGVSGISAFDIHASHPTLGPLIQQRAATSQTQLVLSSEQLAASCEILFSAVTASSARDAASQTTNYLTARHTYVDLNSISPNLKREIQALVEPTGARFVEAAVMAPVPPYGHRVPMLLGGSSARQFSESLSPYGMRFEVVSDAIGTAVAVKMCRSIVVKGLEALLFECVMGASRYGAEDRVFASLQESFPGIDWKNLANYVVGRVVVHGERRAREMEEVAETLRSSGVEPIMAEATARLQAWSARMDLKSHFGGEGPPGYAQVLDIITSKTKP